MYKIEKANIIDIPILCELLDCLFSQEVEFVPNKALQERGLKTIIKSDTMGDIFVVRVENKVVAMVNILYTFSTALGSAVAILEDMIVNSEYRGKGIGRKLMNYILEYLKNNGFKRVTLITDADNTNAHKFYEQNGFQGSTMIPYRKIL